MMSITRFPEMSSITKRKLSRFSLGICIFGAIYLGYYLQPLRVHYIATESVKMGWVITNTEQKTPILNDLVTFNFIAPDWLKESGILIPGSLKFTKQVLGMPGNRIELRGKDIYRCTETCVYVNTLLERTRHGNILPVMEFPYVIPAEHYFVGSDHERGFDSRYWGPINIGQIIGIAKRI